MAVYWDPGGGGGAVVVRNVYSTDGSTTDTGISVGNYSGETAKSVSSHSSVTNVGPIFEIYDPELANLLAMEF